MQPWILEQFAVQAQAAQHVGDDERWYCCATLLAEHHYLGRDAFSPLAERLLGQHQWFRATQWSVLWQADLVSESTFILARVYAAIGLYAHALAPLQRVLALQPDNVAAQNMHDELCRITQGASPDQLALNALQHAITSNDFDAVVVITELMLRDAPTNPDLIKLNGLGHHAAKRDVEALNVLTTLTTWDEDVVLALADALLALDFPDRAEALLQKQYGKRQRFSGKLASLRLLSAAKSGQDALAKNVLSMLNVQDWFQHEWLPALVAVARNGKVLPQCVNHLRGLEPALSDCLAYQLIDAIIRFEREHDLSGALAMAPLCAQRMDALPPVKGLAQLLFRAEQWHECRLLLEDIIKHDERDADCWHMLGVCAQNERDWDHAATAQWRALALQPINAGFWCNYAITLHKQGKTPAALDIISEAVSRRPNDIEILTKQVLIATDYGYYLAADATLEKALTLAPNATVLHALAARSKGNLCETEQALSHFNSLPKPLCHEDCSDALFFLNYHPTWTSAELYQRYRQFTAKTFPEQGVRYRQRPWLANKPLRIAYVSPDFYQHSCFNFIEPVLRHHDRNAHEIYLYSSVAKSDANTLLAQTLCTQWRDLAGLSTEAAATQIVADEIDILIDLAGHTVGNRLDVFAQKPAPIQMTWLGYGYGTGMPQIDYFIADKTLIADGEEHLFAEAPLRLPDGWITFKPQFTTVTAKYPHIKNGYVTFGCLSRIVRINQRLLHTWAKLLQTVVGSHLIINTIAFREPAQIERHTRFFAEYGIAPERLHFAYDSPPWPVYDNIDIMLDCFPHNSGTTLLEGIGLGIPFVTRRERSSMGRLGATIANNLGYPEWIAESDEDYIAIAKKMAEDQLFLAQCRNQLGQKLLASPLCDGETFTRNLETALRQAWSTWCQRQQTREAV